MKKTVDQLMLEEKHKEQAFKSRQRLYDARRAGMSQAEAVAFANDWSKSLPKDKEEVMEAVPSRGTPE